MTISQKWCDERHDKIDKEFKRGRDRMDKLDKKLWTIIILLLMNFTAISAIGIVLAK